MGTNVASPSALSILAGVSANPIPDLVVGGVILTVAGAVFTYKEIKKYEEKIHKQKIEEINDLYKAILKSINIPGFMTINGFPLFFN